MDRRMNVNYCEAGAMRAAAIFGQVSKGISRTREGITSLLDTGLLRDLLNSVSMLILRHPEKMQKNGIAVQKQLEKVFAALPILLLNERRKKLFQAFPCLSKRLRNNLIEIYKHYLGKKF